MLRSCMDFYESCAAGDDEDVEKALETESCMDFHESCAAGDDEDVEKARETESCMDYNESCAAGDDEDVEKAWVTEEEENADIEVEDAIIEVEYSEAQHPKPKRKRKLRSKNSITATKVRRSSRSCVLVNVKKNDYSWAPEEERSLLKAVKKYGHLDMKRLCEAVPYKSESAIKSMITKWCRRATAIAQSEMDGKPIMDKRFMVYRTYIKKKNRGKKMPTKLAPIEQWLQALHKAGAGRNVAETNYVAQAMQYISLFEKHPDPAECGGIDFSALYDYLYRMLMGYPPKDLNEATNNYLVSVMDSLTKEVRDGEFYAEKFHLSSVRKISLKPTTVKEYGSSEKEVNAKPIDKEVAHLKSVLEVPGFNPLSVPLHLLTEKQ